MHGRSVKRGILGSYQANVDDLPLGVAEHRMLFNFTQHVYPPPALDHDDYRARSLARAVYWRSVVDAQREKMMS